MAGIMSPISQKKGRVCYFFDSGAFSLLGKSA